MRKAKKRGRGKVVDQYLRPTPERAAANDFRSAGMAMRVVPVIARLHEVKVLNDREYAALAYYRDQASLADHSPVRSCCDFSPRGGHGPGVSILSAAIETGRIERDMGALWSLVRAVAVDDETLEQWCVSRGSRANLAFIEESYPEQFATATAAVEAGLPYPCPMDVGIATLELKYAAGGITVGRT